MARRAARGVEDGASAVEYCIFIAGVAAAIAIVAFGLGSLMNDTFSSACTSIELSSDLGNC